MPEFMEKQLRAEYGDNPRAIFGTMNKLGMMHGNRETPKGAAAQAQHDADSAKRGAIRSAIHKRLMGGK